MHLKTQLFSIILVLAGSAQAQEVANPTTQCQLTNAPEVTDCAGLPITWDELLSYNIRNLDPVYASHPYALDPFIHRNFGTPDARPVYSVFPVAFQASDTRVERDDGYNFVVSAIVSFVFPDPQILKSYWNQYPQYGDVQLHPPRREAIKSINYGGLPNFVPGITQAGPFGPYRVSYVWTGAEARRVKSEYEQNGYIGTSVTMTIKVVAAGGIQTNEWGDVTYSLNLQELPLHLPGRLTFDR